MDQLSADLGCLVQPEAASTTRAEQRRGGAAVTRQSTAETQHLINELNSAISAAQPSIAAHVKNSHDVVLDLSDSLDCMLNQAQQVVKSIVKLLLSVVELQRVCVICWQLSGAKATPNALTDIDSLAQDALSTLSHNLRYKEQPKRSVERSAKPLLDNLTGFLQNCADQVLSRGAGRETKSFLYCTADCQSTKAGHGAHGDMTRARGFEGALLDRAR